MKTFLFCLMLLPSLSMAVTTDLPWEAKMAKYTVKMYSIKMKYITDLSQITPGDVDEAVERDLAICEGIGSAENELTKLVGDLGSVKDLLPNRTDWQEIDTLEGVLIIAWADMRVFCIRADDNLYRNIPYVQERVQKSQNILDALTEILTKYE
ncbi:hypothetical protein [Bdellovibrio sp. HCB337]|uniref:hypothetical protein n=1 Tax=Bdellovibrio sp. HCB337 TaxID=3394358 RepID=UPI0039A73266